MNSRLLCSIAAALAIVSNTACNSSGPDPAARGSASIAWSITALGEPATCARVGAASVSLLLHNRAASEVTLSFACTDLQGQTPLVTAGAYDATLTLRAADGTLIAAGPTQTAVTIGAGQAVVLAPVVFTTETLGKLALSIATLSTSSNCKSHDQGGAGTTGNVITLVRAVGGCVPVTLTRTRGTTTIGTYNINCSSPEVAPCIENDETLTVDGLDAGPYVINVVALSGATRCSVEVDVFSIPGGATLSKRVQLPLNRSPGC
jgi:hypothetical protein